MIKTPRLFTASFTGLYFSKYHIHGALLGGHGLTIPKRQGGFDIVKGRFIDALGFYAAFITQDCRNRDFYGGTLGHWRIVVCGHRCCRRRFCRSTAQEHLRMISKYERERVKEASLLRLLAYRHLCPFYSLTK